MNRKAHKKQIKNKWQLGCLKMNESILQMIIKLIVRSCLKENKKPSRGIAAPHDAKGS